MYGGREVNSKRRTAIWVISWAESISMKEAWRQHRSVKAFQNVRRRHGGFPRRYIYISPHPPTPIPFFPCLFIFLTNVELWPRGIDSLFNVHFCFSLPFFITFFFFCAFPYWYIVMVLFSQFSFLFHAVLQSKRSAISSWNPTFTTSSLTRWWYPGWRLGPPMPDITTTFANR